MLKINNLTVVSDNKTILKNLNIEFASGESHVIMGPNGAGKSTLCKALMHHPSYQITNGSITFNGDDITNLPTSEIAKKGIYVISQSPVEIEGITNAEMLRTSLLDAGKNMDIFAFNKKCTQICAKLNLPKSFLHRNVNEGMSGGERKKNELFGMWILEPSLVIFDEVDSGLDVDALKIVGENIIEYQKEYNATIIVITHQEKLIELLSPNHVAIISDGTVVKEGNSALAYTVLKNGFGDIPGASKLPGDEKNA